MPSRPVGLSLVLTPDALPVAEGRIVAGRYKVLDRIGAGILGLVVLAEDRQTGRKVALKILMPRLTEDPHDPHGQRALLSAAEDAASIRHAGVVPVIGTYVERIAGGPSVIIVMEYQSTASLRTVLQVRGALPADEARSIIDAVADVAEAAHRNGVLHLDLKPANVFPRNKTQGPGPAVVVTDFGLLPGARACDGSHLAAVGDPEWAAPEVMQKGDVDDRADVYCLGALLEEVLGLDVEVRVDQPGSDLHRMLLAVADRATSEHAADRYPDVSAFRAALFAEPSDDVVTEEVVAPPRSRNMVWVALIGALTVALLVLCGGAALSDLWAGPAESGAAPPSAVTAPSGKADPVEEQAVVEPVQGSGGAADGGEVSEAPADGGEPEPSAAAPRVTVTSKPAGAEVWLDGKLFGVTPLDVPVSGSGPVSVTLRRAGFVARTIDITDADPTAAVTLRRVRGSTPPAEPRAVPRAKELILER